MSIMYAALNPNISSEQLAQLIEKDVKSKDELMKCFTENLDKIEDPQGKICYMENCMPILIQMMFF